MTAANAGKAAGIGFASGLRTMAGPSAVRCTGRALTAIRLAALGELIVDKLPQTPSRTAPFALAARAAAASIAAGCAAGAEDRLPAIALAVAAAMGAAFAGARYRSAMAKARIPDALSAMLEDALAYGVARSAARLG